MIVEIEVVVNSGKNEVVVNNTIIVKVKAQAKNNQANISVIKLLSKYFKKDPRKVKIISGFKSKKKKIQILD